MGQDDTRAKLIEVASVLLASEGEAGIRLADVAKKAKVRQSTIFYHFKDRTDLIEAAQLERYRSTYLDVIEPIRAALKFSDTPDQWEAAVRKVFSDSFVPGREDVRSARASVIGMALTSKRLRKSVAEINREVIEHICALISVAKERGWVKDTYSSVALTSVLMSLVHGRTLIEIDSEFEHFSEWNHLAVDLAISLLTA